MTRHASAGVLSAYLDEELTGEELREVERHLEDCEPCRRQLAGLRSVVAAVQDLERQAPPPFLGPSIVRRVAAVGRGEGLVDRLEARLEKLRLDSSPFVTLALVIAFAAMLVVFAQSLERRRETTRLVVLPQVEEVTLGDRHFLRDEGIWVEVGAVPPPWRQLAADSDEGLELLEAWPRLAELLDDGPVVLERGEGEWVEVLPAQGSKGSIEITR